MNAQESVGTESRYGWLMVALTPLFMALGIGSLLCISVFLRPLEAEFGWARGVTSFAYLAGTVALGVGGIAMGYLADRVPMRRMLFLGALAMGLLSLALSRQTALWQLYAYYVLFGLLGSAAVFVPGMALVGSWFTRNRGLAIGCTTAAFALLQGVLPSIVRYLITDVGWRGAYTALGVFCLAVLVPLSWLMRRPGEGAAQSAASAAAPRAFALAPQVSTGFISVAVVFCCITMATPMVHVVALAQDLGFGPQEAAGVLTVLMVAGLAGRVIIGKLADALGGLPAYLLASGMQTVLVFAFTLVHTLPALYVLAFLFGLGSSAVMTCIFVCVQEMTPMARWGTYTGVAAGFGWTGMGLGGWQGGLFYDLTGSYTVSYANAALAGAINLAILGTLWALRHRRELALAGAPVA